MALVLVSPISRNGEPALDLDRPKLPVTAPCVRSLVLIFERLVSNIERTNLLIDLRLNAIDAGLES